MLFLEIINCVRLLLRVRLPFNFDCSYVYLSERGSVGKIKSIISQRNKKKFFKISFYHDLYTLELLISCTILHFSYYQLLITRLIESRTKSSQVLCRLESDCLICYTWEIQLMSLTVPWFLNLRAEYIFLNLINYNSKCLVKPVYDPF